MVILSGGSAGYSHIKIPTKVDNLVEINDRIRRILAEQDARHGGPKHDDTHSSRDWIAFATEALGEAAKSCAYNPLPPGYDSALLRVAAICVAGARSHLRKIETIKTLGPQSPPVIQQLDTVEKQHILLALAVAGGDKTAAAKLLGIGRSTIQRKMKNMGLMTGTKR